MTTIFGPALLAAAAIAAPGWADRLYAGSETAANETHLAIDSYKTDLGAPEKFDELVAQNGWNATHARIKVSPDKKLWARRNLVGISIEDAASKKLITSIHKKSYGGLNNVECQIYDFDWSPSSNNLTYGGPDGLYTVSMKDFSTKQYAGLNGACKLCAYSHDGKWLAAAGASSEDSLIQDLYIFNASSGVVFGKIKIAGPSYIQWSPDSKKLAVSNGRQQVEIIDIKEKCKISWMPLPHFSAKALAWSPDGKRLAVVNALGAVHLYSTTSMLPESVYRIDAIQDLAWSQSDLLVCRTGAGTTSLSLASSPKTELPENLIRTLNFPDTFPGPGLPATTHQAIASIIKHSLAGTFKSSSIRLPEVLNLNIHSSSGNTIKLKDFIKEHKLTIVLIDNFLNPPLGDNLKKIQLLTQGSLSLPSGEPIVFLQVPTPEAADFGKQFRTQEGESLNYGIAAVNDQMFKNFVGAGNMLAATLVFDNSGTLQMASGCHPHACLDLLMPQLSELNDLMTPSLENRPIGKIRTPSEDPITVGFTHSLKSNHCRIFFQRSNEFASQTAKLFEKTLSQLELSSSPKSELRLVEPVNVFIEPNEPNTRSLLVKYRILPRPQDSAVIEERNAIFLSEKTSDTRRVALINRYIKPLLSKYEPREGAEAVPSSVNWNLSSWERWNRALMIVNNSPEIDWKQLPKFPIIPFSGRRNFHVYLQFGLPVFSRNFDYSAALNKGLLTIREASPRSQTAVKAHLIQPSATAASIEWSPIEDKLAYSSADGCFIFDPSKNKLEQYTGLQFGSNNCSWSPDGVLLAAAGPTTELDKTRYEVQIFDCKNGSLLCKTTFPSAPRLSWSPNGTTLAVVGKNQVKLIDRGTFSSSEFTATGCETSVMDWSNDSQFLAVLRPYFGVFIYNKSGQLLQKHRADGIYNFYWNKDNSKIIFDSTLKNSFLNKEAYIAAGENSNAFTLDKNKYGSLEGIRYGAPDITHADLLPESLPKAFKRLDYLLPLTVKEDIADFENPEEAADTFKKLIAEISERFQLDQDVPLTNLLHDEYKLETAQSMARFLFLTYWSHLTHKQLPPQLVARTAMKSSTEKKLVEQKKAKLAGTHNELKVIPIPNLFPFPLNHKPAI